MRGVGGALLAALRAPFARPGLALLLWLSRLLPIALAFGLPVFGQVAAATSRHPDAGQLLAAPADATGTAYALTGDLFRGALADAPDHVFWLVVCGWVLVTVLAGGITAQLVGVRGPLLAQCGRYAARFLRLGLLFLFAFYAVDVAINTFLAERHAEAARDFHTQDFALEKEWIRGLLFLALVHLLGVVHCYARIDLVRGERRSAGLCLVRGFGTLVTRLPRLLVLEAGLVLLAVAGVALAWFLRGVTALSADAGIVVLSLHLALIVVASYVRTGFELGSMEARCLVLGQPAPQIETPPLAIA